MWENSFFLVPNISFFGLSLKLSLHPALPVPFLFKCNFLWLSKAKSVKIWAVLPVAVDCSSTFPTFDRESDSSHFKVFIDDERLTSRCTKEKKNFYSNRIFIRKNQLSQKVWYQTNNFYNNISALKRCFVLQYYILIPEKKKKTVQKTWRCYQYTVVILPILF